MMSKEKKKKRFRKALAYRYAARGAENIKARAPRDTWSARERIGSPPRNCKQLQKQQDEEERACVRAGTRGGRVRGLSSSGESRAHTGAFLTAPA